MFKITLWMQFESGTGEFCRQAEISMPFVPRSGDYIWVDEELGDLELQVEKVEYWQHLEQITAFVLPDVIDDIDPYPDYMFREMCDRFSSWKE